MSDKPKSGDDGGLRDYFCPFCEDENVTKESCGCYKRRVKIARQFLDGADYRNLAAAHGVSVLVIENILRQHLKGWDI